ncbi:Oxidoreductase BOA17 [Paramyrothecium foliicola]|nr:Oxidoreductase BOA17 [Paramyrothecium foliicola]
MPSDQRISPRINPSSKVWLVTGCSSGFGIQIVNAALARGDRVIATARHFASLIHLEGTSNVELLELDVTDSESVLRQKVEAAVSAFGHIDFLVNNAGYVLSGVWEELSPESVQHQFHTNLFGALNVTRAILPHMRARRSGVVFFMGSISGWHGVAAGGGYSASKFALEGAVESLAAEVKYLGVRVHILVIGQFRTNILDPKKKVSILDANQGILEYAPIKQQMSAIHVATHGAQPGNPSLIGGKIVDLAKMENLPHSQNDTPPLRIPLGSDAVKVMKYTKDIPSYHR